jgi:hypothetical protein
MFNGAKAGTRARWEGLVEGGYVECLRNWSGELFSRHVILCYLFHFYSYLFSKAQKDQQQRGHFFCILS